MKKQTFTYNLGDSFEHYNGYVWTITNISGTLITLQSTNQTDGQTVTGVMTKKNLISIIQAGYYKPIIK